MVPPNKEKMNWNTTLKSFLAYRATSELRLSKFTQSFSLLTPPPGLASTRWSYVIWDFLLLEGWKTTKHHIFVVGLQCFVGQNQTFFFIGRDQFHTFRMGPVTNKLYNNNILYLVRPSYKTPTLRQRQCRAGEDWTQLPLPPKKGSRRCVSPGWMRTWQPFLQKLSSLNKICPHLL